MMTRKKTSQPREKQEKKTRKKDGHQMPLRADKPEVCKVIDGSQVLSFASWRQVDQSAG